jgi:hypothetical protein
MLSIIRVEATQAIQFCMSALPLCQDVNGRPSACADNTVPLVAEKPTVLRLYVTGATPGALVGGVAWRPVPSGAYGSTFTIEGSSGMRAKALPLARTDPSTTLQVPLRPHTAGTYQFELSAVEYDAAGHVVANASSTITLEFVERRRLRIRLVRIHYTGTQNGVKKDVAPPSVQEFWAATDYAQQVLPIPSPGFVIVKNSVAEYDGDFTRIDPGAHDTTWPGYAANRGTTGNLLNILDTLATAESMPPDVIYLGIYPGGVNMAAFTGWSAGRWIISDLDGETIAHELAHKNGVPQHAPCGGPANVDPNFPNFPAFSALPAASIGEVGFDCSTLRTHDPQATLDLMSYCAPKWISPYNYQKIFDAVPPLPPPPPSPGGDRPNQSVFVSIQQIRDRWIIVDLPHFARPIPPRPPIGPTEYEVIARDDARTVVARTPAVPASQEVPLDDVGELLEAELPWHPRTATFELVRGDQVLARHEVGSPPDLEVDFPSLSDLEQGQGQISYRVDARSDDDVTVAVRFTRDGGATWSATVAHGSTGTVDVEALIDGPGPECRLEVLASAQSHTAVAASDTFPVRPRETPIQAWALETRVSAGEPVQLLAVVNGGAARSSGISWTSDLDGELGQGARLSLPLRAGRHRIEVRSDEPFVTPTWLEVDVS